jgi:hypothetical protein
MSLSFQNDYSEDVWIAILYRSSDCQNAGDWKLTGWFALAPGQLLPVYVGKLASNNRYWYYYAYARDGATWSGDTFYHYIPDTSFDWCWNFGNTTENMVGFIEIDVGDNDNYIQYLTN